MNRNPARGSSGVGLVEVLVALLVVSIGMALFARHQLVARRSTGLAHQTLEAAWHAHSALEALRGPQVAEDPTDTRDRFSVRASVDATTREAHATSTWKDLEGHPREFTLHTLIAPFDPFLRGLAALDRSPTGGKTARTPPGRSPWIPVRAIDLGDGRSVWRPVEDQPLTIVLDNADASVLAVCEQDAESGAVDSGKPRALHDCDQIPGLLIAGRVRFSEASPADPDRAYAAPLPFRIALRLEGRRYPASPRCYQQEVRGPGVERHLAYQCVVFPGPGAAWSGRLDLVPQGWKLGDSMDARRVCRYVTDLDGDGLIRANIEHPAVYQRVTGLLQEQNFLVIRGDQACPGKDNPPFVSITEAHQP